MRSYGPTPDPWQEDLLTAWLARGKDGKLSHKVAATSIPRRAGKSWLIEARVFFGIVALGESVIVTTHHLTTTTELFNRLTSYFENDQYPELKAMVKVIRRANGQLAIELVNGGKVRFIARTKSGGRGMAADLLIVDEAQHYSEESSSALIPIISSGPRSDSQQILAGTPEVSGGDATIFKGVRTKALASELGKGCYHEWSMADGDDTNDPLVWAKANPSLGIRLSVDDVEAELSSMSETNFAVERLGSWSTKALVAVIDQKTWLGLIDQESKIVSGHVLAVDVNPNRTDSTIAIAGIRADGLYHVEIVAHQTSGVGWVVPSVLKVAELKGIKSVVIDNVGPAASIAEALSRNKSLKVVTTGTQDVTNACAQFYDAVQDGTLRHISQPALNMAVANGRKRRIRDAWGWNRATATSDITPLVAATLALWGVNTSKVRKAKTGSTTNKRKRIISC
ncbi:hypothetical protein ACFY5D_16710 [Paeniglutamicibacter sp. NPDC012692]|uniref:hypothetical protein n=1 Tax=Paeniglutamicibacter sp. NPDC012692 TaxID=3364388 RepID=UPI00369A39A6